MRKISSPSLAQLLRQLKFTPQEKRRSQLDAAEELFGIIQKEQEYYRRFQWLPFDAGDDKDGNQFDGRDGVQQDA